MLDTFGQSKFLWVCIKFEVLSSLGGWRVTFYRLVQHGFHLWFTFTVAWDVVIDCISYTFSRLSCLRLEWSFRRVAFKPRHFVCVLKWSQVSAGSDNQSSITRVILPQADVSLTGEVRWFTCSPALVKEPNERLLRSLINGTLRKYLS